MSRTNQWDACCKFVTNYFNDIKQQLNRRNNELVTHNESCLEDLTIDILDERLKKYISSQQTQFRHKINNQLSNFKANMHEKQLYHNLFTNSFTDEQVRVLYPCHFLYILIFVFL